MEYGEIFEYDYGYRRYGAYASQDNVKEFFSKETVDFISRRITELTMGVDPENRPIIVSNQNIIGIMNHVKKYFRPNTGDIHTRYLISAYDKGKDYITSMIEQVIEIITSDVRNSLEMEENNRKLTIWTTVYGDFNEHGLRQYSQIKTRERRPTPFQFHMKY